MTFAGLLERRDILSSRRVAENDHGMLLALKQWPFRLRYNLYH